MRKNILFLGTILLAALVLGVVVYFFRTPGAQANLSFLDAPPQTISLEHDRVVTLDSTSGARLPVTLEIKEKQIRFVSSQCPDHICENAGWLHYSHETAACIPAGVFVSVESGA